MRQFLDTRLPGGKWREFTSLKTLTVDRFVEYGADGRGNRKTVLVQEVCSQGLVPDQLSIPVLFLKIVHCS